MITALVAIVATHTHVPAWFDRELAGYVLASNEGHGQVAVRDPKSGFFLVRQIECDGANITLLLTRDRKEIAGVGFGKETGLSPIKDKPLPSLSTSKGISIGDRVSKVRELLGAPTIDKLDGSRKQFHVLTYRWNSGTRALPKDFDETYTFKAGKLIEIQFSQAAD